MINAEGQFLFEETATYLCETAILWGIIIGLVFLLIIIFEGEYYGPIFNW